MKKSLLLAFAFCATAATSFAQKNYALGAEVYSKDDMKIQNGSLGNLVDNYLNTTWQPNTDGQEPDEWFVVKMAKASKFNQISISWNGDRWSKQFEISTSNDGDTWTVIYNGENTDETSTLVPSLREYVLDKTYEAQYVKFQNIQRNVEDQYGVNIGEFMVQNTASTEPYVTGEVVSGFAKMAGVVDDEESLAIFNSLLTGAAYDVRDVEFGENITVLTPANPNALIKVTDWSDDGVQTQFTNNNIVADIATNWMAPLTDLQFDATESMYPVYTNQFISYKSNSAHGFKFTRTIPGGKYVTAVFHTAIEKPAGLKAYTLTSNEDGEVVFTEQNEIAANTPYILYAANAVTITISVDDQTGDYNFANQNITSVTAGNIEFRGTYKEIAGDGATMYGLYNQTTEGSIVINPMSTTAKVGPFRGYFIVSETSAAKSYTVKFVDSETTGITGVTGDKSVSDTAVYSIDGRRVGTSTENLSKGLYIVNGKKVIVK